ncbi:MAG TPA: A/G-specific adenine glycosylase, partial [Blastocatellia bacterium]|nr:A/G-specific adenine glycosylase [Blastocatellia bacterium]
MVSEFMLQQTQAAMIEKHLPRFLKLFPTLKSLAMASSADVLRAWQGLGYNRRALNLHKAAQALNELRAFPQTQEELIALPGIGRYTSAAILAFAFNKDIAVVDVNIERVLSRIWKRMTTHAAVLPMKKIELLDATILPSG